MKKLTVLLLGTEIAVLATAVVVVVVALLLVCRVGLGRRQVADGRTVGVGTVRAIGNAEGAPATGERQIFIEVVAVSGETFIGKLVRCDRDQDVSMLRPGLVVLVAFNPAAREELSLPDDVLAVHASWLASI
jgi:hypothetical protein